MEKKKPLHDPSMAAKILDITSDTLILIDNDGVCVDVVLKTENPYINDSDSLIGKNIFEHFPEKTVVDFRPEFENVVLTGEVSNQNYDLPATDRMYYFKCIMYKYDDSHVLCLYRDITKRSQMKKRLESANRTLCEVERAARIGHWAYNASLGVFEYTGYIRAAYDDQISPLCFRMKDFIPFVHPEDRVGFLSFLNQPLGTAVGSIAEYRTVKDRIAYLRAKIINEHVENGERIIEGYTQNISDLIERRNELEMVLSVVDNSTESIYANHLDGTLVFANRQCRQQNRIPLDADITQYKAYQILDNVHSKEMWDEFVVKLMQNNNFLKYICNEPYIDFDIIASDCTSYIIRNGIGEEIVWSFRRDISAQLRYEEELKHAKELAEESDRLKSAFISNMSHEIRTPLNAIIGFSGIIAQTDDASQRDEYYKIVKSNSNQLLRLVNEVLDLSRMDSGRVEFSNEPVSLNDMGSELQTSHSLCCVTAKLFFDKPDFDYVLNVDRGRLIQVLSNLIINALKFTPEGEIHFGYSVNDKYVEFYVNDTGIGIEAQALGKVFDRFVKANDFDYGSGLGLAICRTIVERMGGEITVESVVNKGSIFRFTIPIDK
jgi:signal transduction histidine kinase